MAIADERIKILEMVQSGKISPEEGARLLQTLENDPHRLKIRINIPATLLNQAVRYLTE